MNQNVLKIFRNFCPEFSGPGERCQFEPQDNGIGKVIKFKPFSIYPENFKSNFKLSNLGRISYSV